MKIIKLKSGKKAIVLEENESAIVIEDLDDCIGVHVMSSLYTEKTEVDVNMSNNPNPMESGLVLTSILAWMIDNPEGQMLMSIAKRYMIDETEDGFMSDKYRIIAEELNRASKAKDN